MLTLNETFAVPDADHAWSVINDLNTLVPCVPGARVKSVDSPQAVKAEIAVRMGAMGMTFTGSVDIKSADTATRTVTIRADTRETLGQSYATGDITICLGDGDGTIIAIAIVGGKAAGMGEGVIVNVLTDLVRSFSTNVGSAVHELARARTSSHVRSARARMRSRPNTTTCTSYASSRQVRPWLKQPAGRSPRDDPPRRPKARRPRRSSNRSRAASAGASTSS